MIYVHYFLVEKMSGFTYAYILQPVLLDPPSIHVSSVTRCKCSISNLFARIFAP